MTIETRSLSDSAIKGIAARIDRPLVLVGMMGVGKSTIGRKLAHLLDLSFRDADDEIERAAQMSVRRSPKRSSARLLDGGPSVIATGGGAFVQADTRALIHQKGIAIWLDSDVATLVDRVTRKDNRPLLRGGDPKAIVTRLKAEREAAYAEAPVKVMSDAGPHGEAVIRILKALNEWL